MTTDAITYFVRGAFADAPKTPQMLEQQQELIADLNERVADLITEGHSEHEAAGLAIASVGDLSILVTDVEPEQTNIMARVFTAPYTVVANAARLEIHTAIITTALTLAVFAAAFSLSMITGISSGDLFAMGLVGAFIGFVWLVAAICSMHRNSARTAPVQVGGTEWLKRASRLWGLSFAAMLLPIVYTNFVGGYWTVGVFSLPILGFGLVIREAVIQYLLRHGKFIAAVSDSE